MSSSITVKPDDFQNAHTMSVNDHLDELRNRVITSAIAIAVAFLGAFLIAPTLINLLKTLTPTPVDYVQLSPGEALMASLHVTVLTGIAMASPVILYQAVRFVHPGLSAKEKQLLLSVIVFGFGLFLLGACFAYFVAVTPALNFLLAYGSEIATPQMSILKYVTFCSSLILLTGILFELPLLLIFLALVGIIHSSQLIEQWRYAVVGVFLTAAIVTPSQDPLSMIFVGCALLMLYLLSIIPMKLLGK